MQLVLCDVCKKNTNKEVPVGTVTRTYKYIGRSTERVIASQEFITEILPLSIGELRASGQDARLPSLLSIRDAGHSGKSRCIV